MIEMHLSRIVIRESSDQQCIFLKEVDGERQFPIVIGLNEALAIDRQVRGRQMPRPMTHDLMVRILAELDVKVARVLISELKDNTFYARLGLQREDDDEVIEVDSRPSDAIALAVQVDAPIFVEEAVLSAVIASPPDED